MGASASREKFRESVSALVEIDVSPDDANFWDELWKIPSSSEEVFELITPESARQLRDEKFDNLATLFTQATAQLCQIVETPYNIYFDQALNCVRVLTRILPFLLEKGDLSGDQDDEMVEQLCWGTGSSGNHVNNEKDADEDEDDDSSDEDDVSSSDESSDEDSSDEDKRSKKKKSKKKSKKKKKKEDEPPAEEEEQEPLALLVVHAALHMLFLPQFTCDFYEDHAAEPEAPAISKKSKKKKKKKSVVFVKLPEEKVEDKEMRLDAGIDLKIIEDSVVVSLQAKPASIVWSAGVGISPDHPDYEGQTRKYDKNRLEVLRMLLSAIADPLYCAPEDYNPLLSRWLAIATAADAPNQVCLFYSLLNTVLTFEPSNSVMMSADTATHLKLVEASLQVLLVLIDAGIPGDPEPMLSRVTGRECVDFDLASKPGFNTYRILLSRIRTRRELTLIFKGFARLLKTSYEGKSGYMNTSAKLMKCHQELLILLWKILEENPLFMQHILTQMDINELVVPMCYLMFTSRRDPARIGLVHICTFILLKLSGERSFGVNINKPFMLKLPCELPLFSGSHADLIGIVLHKLIVNGAYKLVPLYSCFITIICNISPYWRNISLVASVKMVNLFELFSSPKFLYSSRDAYKHLSLVLEVFNNMIQYQYTGNQHLVYALIRRKDSFGKLASLSLTKAQHQCEKVYGGKADKGRKDEEAASSKKKKKSKKKEVEDVTSDGEDIDNSNDESDDEIASKDSSESVNSRAADDSDESKTAEIEYDDKNDGFFMPNEAWMADLKATIPMETVTRLLQHLIPVVDELCSQKNGVVDETEILEVLKDVTLVGLLPVPHAIVIRKYQPNQYTSLWFTAYMWGIIFLRNNTNNNSDCKIFDGDGVQLFQVGKTGTLVDNESAK